MNSLNEVKLIGNVGQDPEIRNFQNGGMVASFSLATAEKWKDRNTGERREKTEWHRVAVFSPHLCELAEKYIKKGSRIYLSGKLETRKWQDQSGADRYSTEVVLRQFNGEILLLDERGKKNAAAPTGGDQEPYQTASVGREAARIAKSTEPDLDDDIPF